MRKQEHLVNIISFTKTGNRLARQIKSILEQKQENSHKADRKIVVNLQDSQTLRQPLREWCKESFT